MSEKVAVFDTTLRDGEQAAGTRLGSREKLILARQLAQLNVDVIEAGYPNSSPEDFEAVQLIGREIQGPAICALSRAVAADIEACGKALAQCKRPRIHTGIGASDIHIDGKFQDERYGKTLAEKKRKILQMAVDAVKLARQFVDEVEFYAEDAGRADPAYLFEMLAAVVAAGATVVNIPDTTGYTVPEQYGALIRSIRENVPGIERAVISVHCHDDLGMAVANTLHGVLNGARQVEGTINGLGERAGNAALEEIVMALRTRADYFGVHTGVETRELYRTSRLVADMLGTQVPPNKAVIGANAFSHSSGIHVDGFLKQRETYEIMRPEDVGMSESRVVLTARTGRHGLLDRLKKLGYPLSEQELDQAYRRFLIVADKKQEVFDEDLMAILHDEIHTLPATYRTPVPAHLQRHLGHPHRDREAARRGRHEGRRRHWRRSGGRRLPRDCPGHQHLSQPEEVRDSRCHQRHRSHGRGHRATRGWRAAKSWAAARPPTSSRPAPKPISTA